MIKILRIILLINLSVKKFSEYNLFFSIIKSTMIRFVNFTTRFVMGNIVITGGATGIGAATKKLLEQEGHHVYVIDLLNADLQADLTDNAQRQTAIETIINQFPEGIDGFIPCAGLGPHSKPLSRICQLNFFAVIDMVTALKPLISKVNGSIVLLSSNSAAMPGLHPAYVNAMLNQDETSACSIIDPLDGHNAYAGSKLALTQWMRKHSTAFASEGIRINAVAPGIISTPLTDGVLQDKTFGKAISDFGKTVPIGRIGQAEEVAGVIAFLLSAAASYICGSVIFIDGGHDAMLRPTFF